jgi:hypothetical protein
MIREERVALQERPTTEPHVSSKTGAQAFLNGLEQYLRREIGDRHEIRRIVESTVDRTNKSTKERHLSFPEGAFLNLYGIPLVSRYLTSAAVGLTKQRAKVALLSESYRHWPEVCSNSPRSMEKHPFKKTIGEDMQKIVARWWSLSIKTSPLAQMCPDLALRPPCPFRIVFEAKYFRQGSLELARAELVRNIYQCFFYLASPRVPEGKRHPAWEYDYSCLLAYDSSEKGNLIKAWQGIKDEVRTGLWNGANIWVMVL